MTDESRFKRRPTTQDISWILDLARNEQLDLNPPYQRRSVWTRKDRQFFLDTIFRGFPSPAIFLHKTTADDGKTTYHVVDGKQRIETILDFAADRLRFAKDYGDLRLDGKKWSQLEGEPGQRQAFWNYELSVEMVTLSDTSVINDVFDRLNRNSRKLTRQELRHARFDGWFMSLVDSESTDPKWQELGLLTTARQKRMADSQAISEILLVLLEGRIHGFDQEYIDAKYASYDDISEDGDEPENTGVFATEEEFLVALSTLKERLLSLDQESHVISEHAKTLGSFYTIASLFALDGDSIGEPKVAGERLYSFMNLVTSVREAGSMDKFNNEHGEAKHASLAIKFWNASRGASTDLPPRETRLQVLREVITEG